MAKKRDWIEHGLLRDEYHDLNAKRRNLEEQGERLSFDEVKRLAWLRSEVG